MSPFEYAPAPESAAVVDIASSYGLFIGGPLVPPPGGPPLQTGHPAPPEVPPGGHAGTPRHVDAVGAGARDGSPRRCGS